MQPLEKGLRNKLERTVKDARDIAEAAARAALEQLGVGEAAPFAHLTESERELRRKLRVHGRQLGDSLNGGKVQSMDRLAEEVAYEHWHRMLFARFLAENNLLMYPDPVDPVAVTLEECEDLAADEGAANGWELAARFAARMLPQIFRLDSPVFQLTLPPEHQQKLERLIADLSQEVFVATDSLGWVYQFWQAQRKEDINKSEVKIGARELPAVTQLFTEPYMVAFLLDNSLGAWWAARRLAVNDVQNAESEEELRRKVSLPGLPLEYLRFVREENGEWAPAAGTFGGWPKQLRELKMLDPCCGSGHFLVAALLMLVPMYMAEQGLSITDAVDRVMTDNIHGLEIDQRCVELAAFALALAAWRLSGGYRLLPSLHLACTGLSISSTREQWMAILEGQNPGVNLRFFFGQLYELFKKAPTLGSLINPQRFLGNALLDGKGMSTLSQVLESAVKADLGAVTERNELGVTAKGLAKAAELLAGRYALVATNVPYLGRGKQDDVLKEFIESQYPLGKADLATAFVLRCLEFCGEGGSTALVTPQNWLFQAAYTKLREMLLHNRCWQAVARLGPGAFETISGQVVNVALPLLSAVLPVEEQAFVGIDVSSGMNVEEKAAMLRGEKIADLILLRQEDQLNNPDVVVSLDSMSAVNLLGTYATCIEGLSTGDGERFIKKFWEIAENGKAWEYFIQNVNENAYYCGRTDLLLWEEGVGSLRNFSTSHNFPSKFMNGVKVLGNIGLRITQMQEPKVTIYTGEIFGKSAGTMVARDNSILPSLWCYCTSEEFAIEVNKINQSLYKPVGTFLKVPFDLDYWKSIADEKYPHGLPEPESDDPTQWLFHGRLEASTAPLQVAVARLLGYRWPAERDKSMRLSQRARELVTRCDDLLPLADEDGIVCIPPVRGEASAADRLLNLLVASYGDEWSTDILGSLLNDAGFAGKSLEVWLREGFFAQHCDLFHQRPLIWHVWDGLRDGFSALLYYHKLDAKQLETLIYTYLGDWISRQKQDQAHGVDGAEEKLAAAESLKKKLEAIREGEAPYDIFARWKPISQQPIDWNPDLNDGVRVNIRPFMTVPDVKTRGAGVLRVKPNIKWDKDRGKEPRHDKQDYPWFWCWDGSTDFPGGDTFTADRHNDCHYTLSHKREARRRAGKE